MTGINKRSNQPTVDQRAEDMRKKLAHMRKGPVAPDGAVETHTPKNPRMPPAFKRALKK